MEKENRGQWGSSFGFVMAAVGSAVGLGNLWGFPFKMGVGGGFAFLIIYLILAVFVGYVVMISELTIGRKTGKSVLGAYQDLSKKYTILGVFGVLSPALILGFYSMLGGYCIKYAVANLGDAFHASWGVGGANPADYFSAFTVDQVWTVGYSFIFVALTVLVVVGGVAGGIEKFTKVAMPALFFMLLIVIVRSVTLPGAGAGLEFVFKPNFEVFMGTGWISVLALAGGQMFFSLSLGMGIMVTYGSYLSKKEDIQFNAILIPFCDTLIAVMASLAIMPAVFAMGLEPDAGPGLLFITLQTVFSSMGSIGPFFGFLFYALVFIAAITSSISLTEVLVSVVIDKKAEKGDNMNRKTVSIIIGLIIFAEAALVSVDGLGANGLPQPLGFCWLDFLDLLSEGLMMPIGAMVMSLIVGWKLGLKFLESEITLEGNRFRARGYILFCLRFVAPILIFLVLLGQIDTFFKMDWF